MTNNELKQLRRLLFLEVSEAATLIGECEPRTWQRWEKGDRAIPRDVSKAIQMLALTRLERLQHEFDEADPNYRYFESFDEYKISGGTGNELKWRLAQSVATALLCEIEADKWRMEEVID
ncbi:DUF1870 family protein [Photobacterium damselae]|uniref:Aca2/YdiL-like domain-containing protein n=1 Tax=Photobacterium damselae TaxID=38293 RepID=UPI000D6612F6|nr:DUF1870 family protein [Photobacterium damselae]AWK84453.1 hypothetical protein BST98_20685 [Photobacterium damselae]MBE8127777.1 DUF1870 family protein [Photobacterium damselae subsp. piscicida]MCG3826230.1 DUF1870 family protein [Photobacterium damselae]TLS88297.1 DUF1870 family protein [Photobacterium damselae subsp. damselae]WIH22035.1 YdiL family protein [Photobacterium damselae]